MPRYRNFTCGDTSVTLRYRCLEVKLHDVCITDGQKQQHARHAGGRTRAPTTLIYIYIYISICMYVTVLNSSGFNLASTTLIYIYIYISICMYVTVLNSSGFNLASTTLSSLSASISTYTVNLHRHLCHSTLCQAARAHTQSHTQSQAQSHTQSHTQSLTQSRTQSHRQ